MRVVVTGSAGFIGQRVCKLLPEHCHTVIACDKQEDVLRFDPPPADAVIHLAANKYATQGETKPYDVCRFNIEATAAALKMAPRVILASTCKAADPITCYGASKLICERMVLNAGGTVLRLVNVLGSSGSVTDIWAAVPTRDPLPVTDCFRLFVDPDVVAALFVRSLGLPPGRYAPAAVQGLEMHELAARLYPARPIVGVPLRFGDRPRERLLNEYEIAERHGDAFVRIHDGWSGQNEMEVAA
jgi:nucleoside-diphosphate-sugar epimerase